MQTNMAVAHVSNNKSKYWKNNHLENKVFFFKKNHTLKTICNKGVFIQLNLQYNIFLEMLTKKKIPSNSVWLFPKVVHRGMQSLEYKSFPKSSILTYA